MYNRADQGREAYRIGWSPTAPKLNTAEATKKPLNNQRPNIFITWLQQIRFRKAVFFFHMPDPLF